MANRKRSASRSRLFSLADRVARRQAAKTEAELEKLGIKITMQPAGVGHVDDDTFDDGCPICVAARAGGDMSMYPGRDGSAPELPMHLVIAKAIAALSEEKPAKDQLLPFMTFGVALEDGSFGEASYCVDGDGAIYWKSWSQEHIVGRINKA